MGVRVDSSGAESGAQRVGSALKGMGSSAEQAQQSVDRLGGVLRTLITAAVVRQIIDYADTWRLLEGRLRLVTTSTNNLTQVQDKLFDVAQKTRVSFESSAELYTRLARSSGSLELSQEKLLRITELVNKTVQTSGATAQEANAAIIQLSQGLATGTIRGDEFRSVSEQLPGLLRALAIGSNKATSEIILLGRNGKLTAEFFATSLLAAGKTIDEEFARVPKTVHQALTVLNNEVLRLVGVLDSGTGTTSNLANAITDLAAHLGQMRKESTVTFGILQGSFEILREVTLAAFSAINLFVQVIDSLPRALPAISNAMRILSEATRSLGRTMDDTGDLLLKLFNVTVMGQTAKGFDDLANGLDQVGDAVGKLDEVVTQAAGHALVGAILGRLLGVGALTGAAAGGAFFAGEKLGEGVVALGRQLAGAEKEASGLITQMIGLRHSVEKLGKVDIKTLSPQDAAQFVATLEATQQFLDIIRASLPDLNLTKEQTTQTIVKLNEWEEALSKLRKAESAHVAAQDDLAKATQRARESATAEIAVLQKKIDILALLDKGLITAEEAQIRMETAAILSKTKETDLARALAEKKVELERNTKALEDGTRALEEHLKKVDEWARKQQESVQDIQLSVNALDAENKILTEGIATRRPLIEIEHDMALARIDSQIATERAKASEDGLTEAEGAALDAKRQALIANLGLKDSLDKLGQSTQNALLTTRDFDSIITGILQGTQDLSKIAEDLGQAVGVRLVKGILFGKQSGEQGIIRNFNQLMGISAGIFQQGGLLAGAGFAGSVLSAVGKSGVAGGLVGLLTGSPGAGVGTSLGSLASSFGAFSSTLAQVGVGLGSILARGFGIGLNTALSIGGAVSNLILPGIGSLVGFLAETLFGGLFAHIPTKGTQIRKAVVQWLSDIKISFADQISSKDYFFEETKALAEQLGTDFLTASKQVLEDKAGPGLAKQLQALGTFVTADRAIELGKSLEQTGTTFGNMLIANLGIDAIPAALDEIIQKAGIGFGDVVQKLSEVFQEGAISAEFYQDAIRGAVDLFFKDFPASIDVARLAMDSFTDDGIFSLSEFQAKFEEILKNVATEGQAAGKALTDSFTGALSAREAGENARKAFLDLVKSALREEQVKKFVSDSMKDFFKDIDLTGPLDLSSEAMQELADRVQEGAENLFELLKAAGLLPDALQEANNEAERFLQALNNIGSTLTGDILNALQETGAFDTSTLTATLQADVSRAVLQGIIDAIVQTAILEPILGAMLQPFRDAMTAALQDGILDAAEIAALLATGAAAMAGVPDAIAAGVALLEGIFNDPSFQAMLASFQTVPSTSGVPAAEPIGAGTPAGGPGDAAAAQQENTTAVENSTKAIDDFIKSLDDTNNALQDLVDAYNDLLAQLAEMQPPPTTPTTVEPIPPLDPTKAMESLIQSLEALLILMPDLFKMFNQLGWDTTILTQTLGDLTDALKQFNDTGTISRDTLLALQADLTALLDILLGLSAAGNPLIGVDPNVLAAAIEAITYALLALDTILGPMPSDVSDVTDATQAFIDEIDELVNEFVEAGKITTDLSEEVSDLIDEYNTLVTTLIENSQDIIDALVSLGLLPEEAAQRIGDMLADITDSFEKQMGQIIDQIFEVDSAWGDIHDTLLIFLTVSRELKDALDAGTISQEQFNDFMKQVFIETIRALKNEFADLQQQVDDMTQSMDDFIAAGQGQSDLQSQLNDLNSDYQDQLKALRDNFVLLILSGEDVRQLQAELTQSYINQAIAIGEVTKENLTGPAVDAIDEFSKKMAGTFDTFADASSTAADAVSKFNEAFTSGDMEGALVLAEDTISAQIALIQKTDELRQAFRELVDTIGDDIQGLIREGQTLQERVIAGNANIANMFAQLGDTTDFNQRLALMQDLREAILQQFDDQQALFAETRDANIAALEETRDADIAALNDQKEARRADLQDTLKDLNDRIAAHQKAEDEIAQIEDRISQLQVDIRKRDLQATISAIDGRIRIAEQAESEIIRVEEDVAKERERILEQSVEEQLRMIESLRNAAKSVSDTINQLLLSDEAALTPRQQLAETERQFGAALAAARGGDVAAVGEVNRLAGPLAQAIRGVFASSEEGQRRFADLIDILRTLGLGLEQDAQTIELHAIRQTSDDIALTGHESLEELQALRTSLTQELSGLDKTLEQQLSEQQDRLKELQDSLEDDIDAIISNRDTLQDELDGLDEAFQPLFDSINDTFEAAKQEQIDAFNLAVADAREKTIKALEKLQGGAEASVSTLADLETKQLVDLDKITEDVGTAVDSIVAGQINQFLMDTASNTGLDGPIVRAINSPGWVASVIAAIQANKGVQALGQPLVVPPPPPNPVVAYPWLRHDILPSGEVVYFQHGGIVTRPTFALLGEAGPEKVTPLGEEQPIQVHVTVNVKGDVRLSETKLGEIVAKQVEYKISRGGVVPGGRL